MQCPTNIVLVFGVLSSIPILMMGVGALFLGAQTSAQQRSKNVAIALAAGLLVVNLISTYAMYRFYKSLCGAGYQKAAWSIFIALFVFSLLSTYVIKVTNDTHKKNISEFRF